MVCGCVEHEAGDIPEFVTELLIRIDLIRVEVHVGPRGVVYHESHAERVSAVLLLDLAGSNDVTF